MDSTYKIYYVTSNEYPLRPILGNLVTEKIFKTYKPTYFKYNSSFSNLIMFEVLKFVIIIFLFIINYNHNWL